MRRLLTIGLIGVLACGCASTKSVKSEETLNVRSAQIVETLNFDSEKELENAKSYYAKGQFKTAVQAYNNVLIHGGEELKDRPSIVMGYADSALALSAHRTYLRKAEKAYAALAAQENLSPVLQDKLLSGQVLLEIAKGDSADIEVRLNEALENNLSDPRLWNALGRFHDQNQDWLIALETYIKALHIANKGDYPTAPVINNMGTSLVMQNRAKDALEKFEQAHALNDDIEIYDNNRRLALILTGRVDKAVAELSDKRASYVYNDAGYVSALTGLNGRARFYYKKAIELSPTYFEKAELNLAALSEPKKEKSGA